MYETCRSSVNQCPKKVLNLNTDYIIENTFERRFSLHQVLGITSLVVVVVHLTGIWHMSKHHLISISVYSSEMVITSLAKHQSVYATQIFAIEFN